MSQVKKRLYKDGEAVEVVKDLNGMHPEMVGKHYVIEGYVKGASSPYLLDNGTNANVAELKRYVAKKKKRLYGDGALVYVKSEKDIGRVVNYRKGNKFPYVVAIKDKKFYRSVKGLLEFLGTPVIETKTEVKEKIVEKVVYRDREIIKAKEPIKEKKHMSVVKELRNKVRAAMRGNDERVLIEAGFTYESGALTVEGRAIVADLQFEGVDNKDLKARCVELAQGILGEKEKSSKKSK